jgi:hypothetical protein
MFPFTVFMNFVRALLIIYVYKGCPAFRICIPSVVYNLFTYALLIYMYYFWLLFYKRRGCWTANAGTRAS